MSDVAKVWVQPLALHLRFAMFEKPWIRPMSHETHDPTDCEISPGSTKDIWKSFVKCIFNNWAHCSHKKYNIYIYIYICSLSFMGFNAAVGWCSCHLNAHGAKGFCSIASRENHCSVQHKFSHKLICGREGELKTMFLESFELLPTLSVGSFTCCQHSTPYIPMHESMEFLWECMKGGEELENEWVWRVF